MTWLGLDPSIASYGWAVLERSDGLGPRVVDVGTWATRIDHDAGKLDDRARRVTELGAALLALLDQHRPRFAVVEGLALGMRTGRGTVQTLGRIRGLTEGLCLARAIPLRELRPDAVKAALTGARNASKAAVAARLRQLFPGVTCVARADENGTDALAVALAGERGGTARVTPNVVRFAESADEDFDLL